MINSPRIAVNMIKKSYDENVEFTSWNLGIHLKLLYVDMFDKDIPMEIKSQYISYKKILDCFLIEGLTYENIVESFEEMIIQQDLDWLIDLKFESIF